MSKDLKDLAEEIIIGTLTGIGFVVLIAGVGLLLALPIKWTWNVTMPYIFGLPIITWGKAWCLYFLCGCLIKASQTNNNK